MNNNDQMVNAAYDEWASTYDDYAKINIAIIKDHPVFVRMIEEEKNKETGLDLGCGTGLLTIEMSKFAGKITGVDRNEKMLDQARQKKSLGAELDFIQADISKNLEFPDNTFDFVVSSLAINHIEQPEDLFKEIYRVLKPSGIFVYDEPDSGPRTKEQLENPPRPKVVDPLLRHKIQGAKMWHGRSLDSLLNSLKQIGFKIEEVFSTKYDEEIEHLLENMQLFKGKTLFNIIKARK